MTSEQELLTSREAAFIKARTQQEMQVKEWGEKLAKVDPSVLEGISLPNPLTLEALVPELYVEQYNPERIKEQYEAANKLISAVNEICDRYNKKAMEEHAEFQKISAAL